ncbi:MAG: hypothetical protein K1W30_16260 [Lachnospiraceae bacterium]
MREMVRRRILWIGIIMLWNAFFLTGCSQGNSSDQEELCENETIAASREHYKGNDFLEVQEEINIRVAEPEITAEKSIWEHCDLRMGTGPDYLFFENAGEGGYHITLENIVAYAVVDYSKKAGMSEEGWSLERIIYRDNHYHAFVKSKSGDYIYFLIDGNWDANERYIVMADIRKGEDAEIKLQNEYAYNSGLTWHSYKEYSDGIREPKTDYMIDGGSGMSGGGMFDSMYEAAGTYAMYVYLDSIGEKSCQWEIDRNSAYMGSGFIADISFMSGSRRVSMLIDVSNAMYAVLDESITSDAYGREIDTEQLGELTQLVYSHFSFLPEETPICVYEGTTEYGTEGYEFALYKETIGKDIVFVNMVFVEKDTETVYTWEQEELVSIGKLDDIKMILPESPVDGADNVLKIKNMSADDLLNGVMEVLIQNGYSEPDLIYDGMIEFFNRNYYMISSFDDFKERISRTQTYYIDGQSGHIYRVGENADFLRTELYYIGDL